MSKKPSEQGHRADQAENTEEKAQTLRDLNKKEEQVPRRSGSMGRMQQGLKFLSDEDIVRRRTA